MAPQTQLLLRQSEGNETLCSGIITWSGIVVRPTTGALPSGNLTVAGDIQGVTSSTNFGTLTTTAGAATQLAFSVQPASTTRTSTINPAVQVEIRDQYGNRTTSSASVSLAIGTNPASGTLSNGGSTSAVSGTASFASLNIDSAGDSYTLIASSAGLASATSNSFNIGKSSQSITFNALSDKTYGDADFEVSATASSGLTPTFSASGVCTVSTSTVHITETGTCTITASQVGSNNYAASSNVSRSFTIYADLSTLNSNISTVSSTLSSATVGTSSGSYPQAAVDTLTAALTTARAVTNTQSQSSVSTAASTLAAALATFNNSVITLNFSTVTTGDGSRTASVSYTTEAAATANGIRVTLAIPGGTTISAPSEWDGSIAPPASALSYNKPNPETGFTVRVDTAVSIGAGDTSLTFDKGVRLFFAGQAGKRAGYSRGSAFNEITDSCSEDSQAAGDALVEGGDCKINSGEDLIIWTKHFTTFLTYVQAPPTVGVGHSGGNNVPASSAPVSSGQVLGAVAFNPEEVETEETTITALRIRLVALLTQLVGLLEQLLCK
ncbi:MAG: hypothetical protein FJY98_02570 [Candidatus Liptonbacteria bacterium]|nr:hypothetical protein [Candidatus Liptonbacteria bacterium]